jgi:hypothetical protein
MMMGGNRDVSSVVISGHQRSSVVIGGHQRCVSEARRGHQTLGTQPVTQPVTQSATQEVLIKGDRTSALSIPLTPDESMPTSGPVAPHLHAISGKHQWQSSVAA